MKLKFAAAVFGVIALTGCSTTSSLTKEQTVSIEPYAEQVKAECIKLRYPEKASKVLSDKDIETLCTSQAKRFSSTSESYLFMSLDSAAIKACKDKGIDKETECLKQHQERYYEKQSKTMINHLRSK